MKSMKFFKKKNSIESMHAMRRIEQSNSNFNYELFNCNNFNIRYWSWNYRDCWSLWENARETISFFIQILMLRNWCRHDDEISTYFQCIAKAKHRWSNARSNRDHKISITKSNKSQFVFFRIENLANDKRSLKSFFEFERSKKICRWRQQQKFFFSLKHRSSNLFFNCFSIEYLRRFHFNYKTQKSFVSIFIVIWHVVSDCRIFSNRREFTIFSCRNWIICAFVVFFECDNLQKYTLVENFTKDFEKKEKTYRFSDFFFEISFLWLVTRCHHDRSLFYHRKLIEQKFEWIIVDAKSCDSWNYYESIENFEKHWFFI